MEFVLFFIIVILFDLAAWLWGFDSREGLQRSAWKCHNQCRNIL